MFLEQNATHLKAYDNDPLMQVNRIKHMCEKRTVPVYVHSVPHSLASVVQDPIHILKFHKSAISRGSLHESVHTEIQLSRISFSYIKYFKITMRKYTAELREKIAA